MLAGPARHGWTSRDVNQLIRDWVGVGHWLPDVPHKPIGLLRAILAWHANPAERPAASRRPGRPPSAPRIAPASPPRRPRAPRHERARAVGRQALGGPGHAAARAVAAQAARRAAHRRTHAAATEAAHRDAMIRAARGTEPPRT